MSTLTPEDRAALRADIEDAVMGYRRVFPAPYKLSSNLALVARALRALDQAEAERDKARAQVQRVREQARGWRYEYSDPVYRDNAWCQGVYSAAGEVIRALDGT